MATKKPKMTQAELRKFRSDVSKLKKAGLTKVDVRKQKPTRHMKDQLKKYAGVLDGSEVVVKVPSRKAAKQYDGKLQTKYDRVIVPKPHYGGKPHWNKKSGDIVFTEKFKGASLVVSQRKYTFEELKALDGKKDILFSVAVKRRGGHEVIRRRSLDELQAVFERNTWRNFANWYEYVNVERATRGKSKIDVGDGDDE